MQKGNVFNKKNLFSKAKVELSIEEALSSIDVTDEYFTNFISSKECETYLYIKKCYDRIKKGNYDFLEKEFIPKEYKIFNPDKNSRLRNFIFSTNGILFRDDELQQIIKYKNKEKRGIQFFVKYDSKSEKAIIYLIDLYHMVIPTENKQIGARITNKMYYQRIKRKVEQKVNLKEVIET